MAEAPAVSEFQAMVRQLGILARFVPRPINETPPPVNRYIIWQQLADRIAGFYTWRIASIASENRMHMLLTINMVAATQRIVRITLNAILAKIVEVHRQRGIALPANITGPAPGTKFPQLSAYIIEAIGIVTPSGSANVTYVPIHQDAQSGALDNVQIIGAATDIRTPGFDPVLDSVLKSTFESAGVKFRSVNWLDTAGSPAWLCGSSDAVSSEVTTYPIAAVKTENFDPATTILAHLCTNRVIALADARYIIQRPIERSAFYTIASEVFEK
jgi:hypothetical protein